MKHLYPDNHGLSTKTTAHLVHKVDNGPALTDAQFASLDAGVGRGESMLVVSPTSTGKTQIALWAMANSLEANCRTVYLVTHRALAKQKFEDFRQMLLPNYLENDAAALVIATGDYVEDSNGELPKEPLGAPLLVATYEKYLAMLSASGTPSDMSGTVIVCDEIQLLGDANRGQSVEVLLTLLRTAGWRQFVGLSAVMQSSDAADLAGWLGVQLVIENTREKHLEYECWTPRGMGTCSTASPENVEEGKPLPAGVPNNTIAVVHHLLKLKTTLPIIVFCMKKKDVSDLANEFLRTVQHVNKGQLSLAFDGLPETSANTFLAKTLECRVAIHNADLTDEERTIIEQHLADDKLDVVFATSTLAAGVNYSFGAAVFSDWKRWNSEQRQSVAIESSDFHNMAGRVGRMGFDHAHGRVIFFANTPGEIREASKFLNLGDLPPLESRITPDKFAHLALQLVASGLCSHYTELENLVCTTLSALREQSRNAQAFGQWPKILSAAVQQLLAEGFLIASNSGKLVATPVGRAVGFSGLLPSTSTYLLNFVVRKAPVLAACLPTANSPGALKKLAFVLFHACFSSPEFRRSGTSNPTRFVPYPIERNNNTHLLDATPYAADMVESIWQADLVPVNSAKLCCDWIDGAPIRTLEQSFANLGAGALLELFRNLSWVLQGLSSIASAAADSRVAMALRPPTLRAENVDLSALAKLPRIISRLSFRLNEGLPDDVLWMTSLNLPGSPYRLQRTEILALKKSGFSSPEMTMLGTPEADALRALVFAKAKPAPQVKGNWLRDSSRAWKSNQRQRAAERHARRATKCARADLLEQYYTTREIAFEAAFEAILTHLKIAFEKLDDRTKTGAPDYLVTLEESPPIVVEIKTKKNANLVEYNTAVEVLAASEVHGYREAFCVTLCHPGVDPSVPLIIASCGRLSVVESHDFAEALLRICEGTITQAQLWKWLATPGQALSADLPYREYAQ